MLFDNGYLFLCFLPLAKLWTGASMSTQPVSFHLEYTHIFNRGKICAAISFYTVYTFSSVSVRCDYLLQSAQTCSAWEDDTREKSVHDLTKHDTQMMSSTDSSNIFLHCIHLQ